MTMSVPQAANTALDKPVTGRSVSRATLALVLLLATFTTWAQATSALTDIGFSSLAGNRVLITLTLDGPAAAPLTFTIDNPARIALDFPDVANKVARKSQNIGVGAARSVNAVEAKGRTRVVLNLVQMVPYETRIEGNQVYVTLESSNTAPTTLGGASTGAAAGSTVSGIDFRRGKSGEGRVIVKFDNPAVAVDVREEGGKIIAVFADTKLPESLTQRLDVTDFATPVTSVDTRTVGGSVRMEIAASGHYEHMAYQSDAVFTLEVKPVSKEQQEQAKKQEEGYTGEKLSLNFQNIEVRAVLQLIADFTGLNLVASDTVTGNVTLRLQNVPWDQALDIVLRTKGLDMRKMGNVILVGPADEIAAREKQELEAAKQIQELEPLRSELIQVNYAKASEIAALLKAQESSMLSERGNATVDERTNTLLVMETAGKLAEIRQLVAHLDVPIRQVLIESRVVIAGNNFSRDLGVRFGATMLNAKKNGMVGTTGSSDGVDTMVNSALSNIRDTGTSKPVDLPSLSDRLNVNLLPAASAGRIAFGFLGPDYMVDLELAAMQREGQGEVVSSPRVITANQKEAVIEQGVEIPYQEASSSGATSVSFKKAVLSLKVTPQITPDDRVIMDLRINKDSVGAIYAGVPSINTREIATQVLVDNGETVVLGGVYEQTKSTDTAKVPLLGDLPVVGRLFRNDTNVNNKEELLIFITPKILKESLGIR
jgi:type IV pilus assembly protein PilQ